MARISTAPHEHPCPRCGAAPGRVCRNDDGEDWANHAERINFAAAMAADAQRGVPQVALARRLPRAFVRTFFCPACGAEPGQACTEENGEPREPNHAARAARARRVRDKLTV